MSNKPVLQPFTDEEQKHYERLARLEYGPDIVNASVKRWNSYTKAQQTAIMEESGQIYADMATAMEAGARPDDPDVQAILKRWEANLNHFYEPTLDILRGLGTLYNTDPDFIATFQKFHPDLPPFLQDSIEHYVDLLETRMIERLLAEDADDAASRLAD